MPEAKKPAARKPSKAPMKTPGRNGFRYRERYGVIVLGRDEKHQERVFARLQACGHTCRVVVV